jgi:hypothetical protein
MRRLAVLSAALLAGTSPALALPFAIDSGTDTTGKAVTGTDTGTVAAGAALTTSGTSITWSGPSSAPGVTIDNSGTISSTGGRAIDTAGSNTVRNLTLENRLGATISASSDTFRINSDVVGSTVTINNAGRIVSAGNGQALDFDAVTSPTANIQINNLAGGVIEAAGQDAIRPGQAATVTNSGMICVGVVSGGACSGGVTNENHDGVDWQQRSGTIVNKTGGVISGKRHGTTSDVNVNVANEAGALIVGRNGSGVGSDGAGTVVNHGTIRGSWDGAATNGDGDGVDIDNLATVTNFGVIEGTSAAGVGSDGLANTAEGLALGGGSVDNKAGARITGGATGMLVDNSSQGGAAFATIVRNAGRIEGLAGYGVRIVGTQADTIRNAGIIAGTAGAIDLGGGNDLLQLETGSTLLGKADGGDGFDTIEILSDVTLGDVVNFEKLVIDDGATLDLASDLRFDEVLGAIVDGDTIANIDGNGFDIVYNPLDEENAYLLGRTYQLAGGGLLVAVPEPAAALLFLPALIALLASTGRGKAAGSGALPAAV